MQICTLKRPSREVYAGEIRVPEDAPQEVVDLMIACRSENPRDRPMIGRVCDILDSLEESADHISVQLR